MSSLSLLLVGLIFCFFLMTISWFIAGRINFYSLVDAVWAYGIGFLGVFFVIFSDGSIEKNILVVLYSTLWSLRLGTYLTVRLKSHYPHEDRRYVDLKNKWGKGKFFVFFQFQGLSQLLFSLPFLFLAIDADKRFTILNYVGLAVFIVGFLGESIADIQLNKFKKLATNKNLVCNVGLWKYTRHPNYFFEWLIWCGISISAMTSPYGYFGLLSPILMYLTLNYLTGVPAAEDQSLKSKGDLYREYQRTTNRFFPGIGPASGDDSNR